MDDNGKLGPEYFMPSDVRRRMCLIYLIESIIGDHKHLHPCSYTILQGGNVRVFREYYASIDTLLEDTVGATKFNWNSWDIASQNFNWIS
ncbi:unnamed protein product [Leptidea sinapis]|uniref:Uncharacterized protein n=1 Tax=Leptidea sinapis TaxID=189913 RepID=A0A5E4R6R9_9NEOP|nr:unnamed protein product [Leptidea sinapis]